jgi:uncharacterized protein with von Willebrand factor type A (vWA) domain
MDQSNQDRLSTLPPELLVDIAGRLDYPDVKRLCEVARIFLTTIYQDDQFWRHLYRRDISRHQQPSDYLRSYREAYQEAYQLLQKWQIEQALEDQLIKACVAGYDQVVERLIVEGGNNYDEAMVNAAWAGHGHIVEMMLKHGATYYNSSMASAVSVIIQTSSR